MSEALRFYIATHETTDYDDLAVTVKTCRAFLNNRDTNIVASGADTALDADLKQLCKDALARKGITWATEI